MKFERYNKANDKYLNFNTKLNDKKENQCYICKTEFIENNQHFKLEEMTESSLNYISFGGRDNLTILNN